MRKEVKRIINSEATSDGDGVNLRRAIGTRQLLDMDPFLLLDEMHSDNKNDYIGGFPSHPHRGFDTISYMLQGAMLHEDSTGAKGEIQSGGLQWMSTGSGIIHSEMPKLDGDMLWGFQIWMNVKSEDKMNDPVYKEFKSSQIPEVKLDENSLVRVLAGSFRSKEGVVNNDKIKPLILDVRIENSCTFKEKVEEEKVVLIYVYKGKIEIGSKEITEKQIAILDKGDEIDISSDGGGFLILSGKATGEPIARGGPFVMNTKEEILEAFQELRDGSFPKSA